MRFRFLLGVLPLLACGSTKSTPGPEGNAPAPLRPIELGSLDCGTSARGAIAIPAPRDAKLTWRASVLPADFFTIEGPRDGVLERGTTHMLDVRAEVVGEKVIPGQPVQGTVHIETDDPEKPSVDLPVSFTPEGARIEAPITLNFGLVPNAAPAPTMNATLRNTGTRSVKAALGAIAAAPFALDAATSSVELNVGGTVDVPVRFHASGEGSFEGALPLELRGVVCGAKNRVVALAASATGSPVGVSPGSVTLQSTACGAAARSELVTLTNYGTTTVAWSSAWASSNTFQASPSSGSLGAGQSTVLTVSRVAPSAVPAASTDALVLSFGSDNFSISVAHQTTGALVRAVGGPKLAVADQRIMSSGGTTTITLVNDGNEPVTIAPEALEPFTSSAGPFTIAPGSSLALDVQFAPTTLGAVEKALSLHESATCAIADLSVAGYGFARARSIWANRGVGMVSSEYSPPYCCFELDDDGLYCRGAHLGRKPAGATLMAAPIVGQFCMLPLGSTVPHCGLTLWPYPDYSGWQQTESELGLRSNGQVTYGYGQIDVPGLTNVTRLAGTTTMVCAPRSTGGLECWSPGSNGLLEAIEPGTHTTPQSRVVIPGVADALDAVHFVRSDVYPQTDVLYVLRAAGTVTRFVVTQNQAASETLPGISDAAEIRSAGTVMVIRHSSGLLSSIDMLNGAALPQPVGVTDIAALGIERGVLDPPKFRWQLVKGDGRILQGETLDALSLRPGFDR